MPADISGDQGECTLPRRHTRKETSEAIHCRAKDFYELLKRQNKEKVFSIARTKKKKKRPFTCEGTQRRLAETAEARKQWDPKY